MVAARKAQRANGGFTLVELVIVMSVLAIILSVVIPNLRGMQQEGQLAKAEAELQTLKTALISYWRNNNNAYPSNVHAALTSASPRIINEVLVDPFQTDTTNHTYGYITGSDTNFGDYFVIYTKGPKADTSPTWDATNQRVNYGGGGKIASNAPLHKQ